MNEPPPPGRLRPRYVRRVTDEHVGQRVSVRHLVDDADRGPRPADVVGRLAALDDDVMLVIDRHGDLVTLDPARVVASRVIPPHPRRPPEPPVGTRTAPLVRDAARTLLVDDADRVLLVAHTPGEGRRVWTAPGGGVQTGEDHREAARREVSEEIGIEVEPGPWVWHRRVVFPFRRVWLDQRERWFWCRVTDPPDAAETPLVDAGIVEARWWSPDDLAEASDELAPARLADHLGVLLADGLPDDPVDVGE